MCQSSVFAKFWVIKNEVFAKKIAFFVFSCLCWKIETEKRKKNKKGKIAKNPIKIGLFARWSSKNVKKSKTMDF